MIIREPAIYATRYYLRETPGDSPTKRHEHHDAFVADAGHALSSLAGWLSMPAPALPSIPEWDEAPPENAVPLMDTGTLQGRVNATAWVRAYALQNMLLLRVILARTGEHDQHVWSMLDEALGHPPQTPSWLHTTHYWCGIAPRPPEDLDSDHWPAIQTAFGVLSLASSPAPHVLVYPDARTEARAASFLNHITPVLDWYPIQAGYCQERYDTHTAAAIRTQRQALDRLAQAAPDWPAGQISPLQAMGSLGVDLETLESTYGSVLDDLAATQSTAHELGRLSAGYRMVVKQSGLWDVAPYQWEAQAVAIDQARDRVEADVHHLEITLRRIDAILRGTQLRADLVHGERERLMVGLLALVALALVVSLIVDSDPVLIGVRVAILLVLGAAALAGWRWSQRR